MALSYYNAECRGDKLTIYTYITTISLRNVYTMIHTDLYFQNLPIILINVINVPIIPA